MVLEASLDWKGNLLPAVSVGSKVQRKEEWCWHVGRTWAGEGADLPNP